MTTTFDPERMGREPLPVYRDVRGRIRTVTGRAAETWPYPRVITVDGVEYVEWILPSETGWGISFGMVQRPRTPIGVFLLHYWEGRSSGFPLLPVLVFSAKRAIRRVFRRHQRVQA